MDSTEVGVPEVEEGTIQGNGDPTPEEKAIDLAALKRSVVDTPQLVEGAVAAESYILWVAAVADAITPWGSAPKARDQQLRAFLPTENFLLSALGIVTARNTALSWTVEGPPETARLVREMLLNADLGEGWEDFVTKVSIDLYSQDMGAFVEMIRSSDRESASVIGINHLDAIRCYPTGNAEVPYVYVDRNQKYHYMKWYQIVNLMEMPSPIEHSTKGVFYKLQYCAVTRLLRAAQIIRNITIYKDEKTGGRFNRAIHLVKGITPTQIREALAKQTVIADNQGLQRYIEPLMVGSVAPNVEVGHDTIEMASLPDNFDEETTLRQYITAIAMAFLTDYQEFAPLPGGNIGTSQQSYILHLKSRGKGPALFQKVLTHFLNYRGVLPQNVQFAFTELDVQAESEKATVAKLRADERAIRITSGEITVEAARQLAVDAGDLSLEVLHSMGGVDMTPLEVLPDVEKPPEVVRIPQELPPPSTASLAGTQTGSPAGTKELDEVLKEAGLNDMFSAEDLKAVADEVRHAGPEGLEHERLETEDMIKERALMALRKFYKRVATRMRQQAKA